MHISKASSTRKGVALKVLTFIVAAMLGTAAYLYFVRSSPVLYKNVEAGDPVKEPTFSIFNPFRDRSPEHSAEAFLKQLRAGQCEQATVALSVLPERRQDICERERRSPLASWRLKNRTDEPQKIKMYYQVKAENHNDLQGQAWVTVEKQGEKWQVTSYERFY